MIGFSLNSCKKDKEPQPDIRISFKVDGAFKNIYAKEGISAIYSKHLISSPLHEPPVAPTLTIFGKVENSEIRIGIKNFNGPGDYLIDEGGPDFAFGTFYSEPGVNPYSGLYLGIQGSVNVTTFDDKTVQGTFEFIARNANHERKNVTHGYFKLDVSTM
jgi:hypothetical protein